MKIKKISKHMVRPYLRQTTGAVDNDAAQLANQEDFKKGYFAFTSLLYRPQDGLLYCGNTNFGNDLLRTFCLKTHKFTSLNYQNFGEKYEIKIHRSLELGNDGKIYGATSSLHGVEFRLDAPGGKMFSYDPETQKYECLCIPKEHDYIQTITLDNDRQMIYGFTYPVFEFFAFSLKTREVVYRQFMDSISHISAIDDGGGYWGTWSAAHKLFRYEPGENRVKFYNHGFPEKGGNLMYRNAGPIDCMLNGKDGYMYIAMDLGSLYRLDPKSAELTFLGKPFPAHRLPGLALGGDGMIYLCGGEDDKCQIAYYDRKAQKFEVLCAAIVDDEGEKCSRTHDLKIVGNSIFVGETDHPKRTDYLWECVLG